MQANASEIMYIFNSFNYLVFTYVDYVGAHFLLLCLYVFVSSGPWPIAASSIEDVSGFAFTLQSVVCRPAGSS